MDCTLQFQSKIINSARVGGGGIDVGENLSVESLRVIR